MAKSAPMKGGKKDTKDSKGGAGNKIKDKVKEKDAGAKNDVAKRKKQ